MKWKEQKIDSPVGTLTLLASDDALVGVLWPGQRLPSRVSAKVAYENNPILDRARVQLREHFSGTRKTFNLPIEFHGTDFQKRVWKELLEIPYGKVRSYREVAMKIRKPTATRAVGAAIGQNLLSIVVPCHRVVGSNGALTGFAGGLPTKKFLLALES